MTAKKSQMSAGDRLVMFFSRTRPVSKFWSGLINFIISLVFFMSTFPRSRAFKVILGFIMILIGVGGAVLMLDSEVGAMGQLNQLERDYQTDLYSQFSMGAGTLDGKMDEAVQQALGFSGQWELAPDPRVVAGIQKVKVVVGFFVFVFFGVFFYRGFQLALYPKSEFVALPIIFVVLRLLGDFVAWLLIFLGVIVNTLVLSASHVLEAVTQGEKLWKDVPIISNVESIDQFAWLGLGGLVGAGFLVLMVVYLISEFLIFPEVVARNVRITREVAEEFREQQMLEKMEAAPKS